MITQAKVIGTNVSYETYSRQAPDVGRGHKDFIMSRGELMNFASNPKRYLDGYQLDSDETKATEWGSLIDVMGMTPERFDGLYSVTPAMYQSKGMQCPTCKTITDAKTCRPCKTDRVEVTVEKEWNNAADECKKWCEKQGGRSIIKADLFEKAKLAVAVLLADEDVKELFECSQKQVMVVGFWKDPATGLEIPIRSLLDLVPDANHLLFGKWLCDSKTARNGDPDFWDKVTNDSGYDVQAAMSRDLYVKAAGEDRVDWIFPVQENVNPWHVVKPFPALTSEFFGFGRLKYQTALTAYARCVATGKWPSYSTSNRMVFNRPDGKPLVQFIGPEKLWAWREYLPPHRTTLEKIATGTS